MLDERKKGRGDLVKTILETLENAGIDPSSLEIIVRGDSGIIVRGEVNSEEEKKLVLETLIDDIGIVNITDNLIVLNILDDFPEDIHNLRDDQELRDDDNECMGTEDIFRSVEEGLPYIPPMRPTRQQGISKLIKWKKRKKKVF